MTPTRRRTDALPWPRRNQALFVVLLILAASILGLFVLTERYHTLAVHNDRQQAASQLALYDATLGSCMRQNEARRAANRGALALRRLTIRLITVSEARLPTLHGPQRAVTINAIALYKDLRDNETTVPIVDCPSVVHHP